jgi:hypothetical protein
MEGLQSVEGPIGSLDGGDQERLVDLRGERLTLSTRALLLRGIQRTAHLIWERVSTSKQ